MAFGQKGFLFFMSWGVAPGYDEHGRWPINLPHEYQHDLETSA